MKHWLIVGLLIITVAVFVFRSRVAPTATTLPVTAPATTQSTTQATTQASSPEPSPSPRDD